MSDYYFDASMLRGEMADKLVSNTEQFMFVITNALSNVIVDEVIDVGQLGDEVDATLVVGNLRMIADAIENGDIT